MCIPLRINKGKHYFVYLFYWIYGLLFVFKWILYTFSIQTLCVACLLTVYSVLHITRLFFLSSLSIHLYEFMSFLVSNPSLLWSHKYILLQFFSMVKFFLFTCRCLTHSGLLLAICKLNHPNIIYWVVMPSTFHLLFLCVYFFLQYTYTYTHYI